MANHEWGHCMHCQYFASPAKEPLEEEEAACEQPALAKVQLRVFGACGCENYENRSTIAARAPAAPP